MNRPPSGAQYEIAFENQRATVVEVGGSIREYVHGGRPVLDPYALDAMCDGAHGTPLVPWPNRLADGRYRFDGRDYQVALTEPAKRNAIHGFLRWQPWRLLALDREAVTVGATVFPQSGYPFLLEVAVEYRLGPGGLRVTTTATNAGQVACPFGSGQHPYLSPGAGLVDDAELALDAATRILTDAERQLPVGQEAVAGTAFDFRTRRRIGALQCDFAFTDLARDASGLAWLRLWGTDGACAELWVDGSYAFIEVYTGDTLAPDRRRLGLGAEPMSCPPNAFQTGELVHRLEPGASVTQCWGARLQPGH